MSTLNDVARLAGVSTMTVSRVVNGNGYTSPATQARVNQAIAELGYMPNVLARQLRSSRTKTLALVLTDIANPFFTTIARGVEDAARAQGYAVMFCNTDESVDLELEYVRVLIQRRVDGVLLVPAADSSTSLDLLKTHKLPAVVLDRRLRSGEVDEVRADSEGGAYAAVRHLIDLGHRQIAVLAGPESVSTSADRVAGYRRAMLEAGIDPTTQQILFGQYTEASGYEMTGRLLAAPTRPTAIFAGNNFIAFGAIQALRESGLEIPDDMSIVVFDDLPQGWIMPFLTVIAQPAYEIGRLAAEMMLERLASEEPIEPRTIVLPSSLIVRRSSAPPRSTSAQPAPAGANPMENPA
ncbi:MAG: LacI family DNA-binding transcriptional regulator [Candidatus Limnocylindrales bacterium]